MRSLMDRVALRRAAPVRELTSLHFTSLRSFSINRRSRLAKPVFSSCAPNSLDSLTDLGIFFIYDQGVVGRPPLARSHPPLVLWLLCLLLAAAGYRNMHSAARSREPMHNCQLFGKVVPQFSLRQPRLRLRYLLPSVL